MTSDRLRPGNAALRPAFLGHRRRWSGWSTTGRSFVLSSGAIVGLARILARAGDDVDSSRLMLYLGILLGGLGALRVERSRCGWSATVGLLRPTDLRACANHRRPGPADRAAGPRRRRTASGIGRRAARRRTPRRLTTCHVATDGSPRPAPRREGPPGRLRRLRRLGRAGRGRGRQAHLLRPLRPAAPRPGVGRHRGQQRLADPRLQGHGPGLPGLRRGVTSSSLRGHLAVGHTPLLHDRRRASGRTPSRRSGPPRTGSIALGHNGNLTNTGELLDAGREARGRERQLPYERRRPQPAVARGASATPTDTALITALLASLSRTARWRPPRSRCCPQLRGAFSLVFMDEDTLYAARDPQGIRPLVLGRLERGWVVASETAALDIVGASVVREIEPGELIAIDEHGLRTSAVRRSRSPRAASSSTSTWPGRTPRSPAASVHAARVEIGPPARARRRPVEADLVIPVPESGTPAAVGYAQGSGIPYGARPGEELLRRPHLHPAVADHPPARHPAQAQPAARGHRRQAAGRRRRLDRARQHPARAGPDAARGRRRRGARAHLLAAGEVAVLLRHRLRHPRRADRQRPGRRRDPRLDRRRLAGLHLARRLVEATEQPRTNLCRACFDGVYPIELPEPELLGKHLLEIELAARPPHGRADAIRRPWPQRPASRPYDAEALD